MSEPTKTREAWLIEAVRLMTPDLEALDVTMPAQWGVSVGFPLGKNTAIGQCFDTSASKAQRHEMFISPVLDDVVQVLATLLHEMVHAAVGIKHGHRAPFKRVVKALGLAGKVTATFAAEGSECYEYLKGIAEQLGEYPHKAMTPRRKLKDKKEPPVKLQSPTFKTFKFSLAVDIVKVHGLPKDPWGNRMLIVDERYEELKRTLAKEYAEKDAKKNPAAA